MLGQRTMSVMGLAAAAALVGVFAMHCGSSDSPAGTGGGAGTGSTATGGSSNGTGGGTGGTSSGTGGIASPVDGGGDSSLPASCTSQPLKLCQAIVPPALIADFAAPEAGVVTSCSGIEGPPAYGSYGASLSGGTYVYPNYAVPSITLADGVHSCAPQCTPNAPLSLFPLRQDLSGGNWHVTGTVGDYSGFGLYVAQQDGPGPTEGTFAYAGTPYTMMDASAFSGIKFTISGNAGTPSQVFVNMSSAGTVPTVDSSGFSTCGTCALTTSAACGAVEFPVTVTSTPTTVTVTWAQVGIADPSAFMGISWRFNNPAGIGTAAVASYPIDITVDDIAFATP